MVKKYIIYKHSHTRESTKILKTLTSTEKIYDKSYPARLIRIFLIISLISAVTVFLLINYGMYRIFLHHSIEEAEEIAKNITNTLYEQEKALLYTESSSGYYTLGIKNEDIAKFDSRMRNYLNTFNILKIKVFAKDGTILYSTDKAIIGRTELSSNLIETLKGNVISQYAKKEIIWDLEGEQRFDLDVVETYVPVYINENSIAGAFEIYMDITYYRAEISKFVWSTIAITMLIMSVVFGILFLLIRSGAEKLKMAHAQMEKLAKTDSLTNIFNRRFLLTRIDEELSRIKRVTRENLSDSSIGLIMIDIDHFKRINDIYGHQVGDQIIKETASRIKKVTREYEIVGRYGGEEFLVASPNADLEETRKIAERIREAVSSESITVEGEDYEISISAGVSCIEVSDKNIDIALKKADEGLYTSKALGRDRVSII